MKWARLIIAGIAAGLAIRAPLDAQTIGSGNTNSGGGAITSLSIATACGVTGGPISGTSGAISGTLQFGMTQSIYNTAFPYTVNTSSDCGVWKIFTTAGGGTVNLPSAASAGVNFFVLLDNETGSTNVLHPNGTDTINGTNANLSGGMLTGAGYFVESNGSTAWRVLMWPITAVVLAGGNNTFTGTNTFTTQSAADNSTKAATTAYVDQYQSKTFQFCYSSTNGCTGNSGSSTWTPDNWATTIEFIGCGGGGGGGSSTSGAVSVSGGAGGGGGGCFDYTVAAADVTGAGTMTTGAGGTAGVQGGLTSVTFNSKVLVEAQGGGYGSPGASAAIAAGGAAGVAGVVNATGTGASGQNGGGTTAGTSSIVVMGGSGGTGSASSIGGMWLSTGGSGSSAVGAASPAPFTYSGCVGGAGGGGAASATNNVGGNGGAPILWVTNGASAGFKIALGGQNTGTPTGANGSASTVSTTLILPGGSGAGGFGNGTASGTVGNGGTGGPCAGGGGGGGVYSSGSGGTGGTGGTGFINVIERR